MIRFAVLGLMLVAGLIPVSAAQDEPVRDRGITLRTCPPSATRTGSCDLEQQETVIRTEKEISVHIDVPLPETRSCQATISIEYIQRNTIASVTGEIEHPECAASSGDYVIAVSTRDESGELKTTEYTQSWQRNDDQTVQLAADYLIGENVDLVRVRASRLRCSCNLTENIEDQKP